MDAVTTGGGDAASTSSAPTSAPETTSTPGAAPEATPAGAAPATPAEPRRFKVAIDGQEQEVEEAELLRGYQRGAAANKRFREAAEERQRIQAARERMKTDLPGALKEFGLSEQEIAQFAQQLVYSQFEQESLTPEQRQQAELQRRVKELEAEKQAQADAQKGEETKTAETAARAHWQKTILGGLEKAQLPPVVAPLVAGYLADAIEHDRTLDPAEAIEDAIAQASEDIHGLAMQRIGALKGDGLLKALGPAIVDEVRRTLLEQFKAKRGAPGATPAPARAPEPPKPMSQDEWRERMLA